MKKNQLSSAIIMIVSLIGGLICWLVVFNHFDKVFFEFLPLLYLCLGTFVAGLGMWIGALLLDNKDNDKE